MKQVLYCAFFGFSLLFQGCIQSQIKDDIDDESIIYKNDLYRFKIEIPTNWKLHGQRRNDTTNKMAIVDWGLPSIYSNLEKKILKILFQLEHIKEKIFSLKIN